MNLFKHIFWKNFHKTPATKLVDDLDPTLLRGYVNIQQYDPYTNKIIKNYETHNTLVNQSKTTLIRLISQAQTPWYNGDPTALKISKMRFGNNLPTENSNRQKLLYYKINERSYRANIPTTNFPGGYKDKTQFEAGMDTKTIITQKKISNTTGNYTGDESNYIRIYKIIDQDGIPLSSNPPSHGTFKVELYKDTTLVETLYFYHPTSPTDLGPDTSTIYSRGFNKPKLIVSEFNEASNTWIVDHPDAQKRVMGTGVWAGKYIKQVLDTDNMYTFLFYDYIEKVWKLQIKAISGRQTSASLSTIAYSYYMGLYNVINSIVPRTSYNVGIGLDASHRYPNLTTSDYYPILPSLEYRDSDTDYVDDFSVTFSVNMSANYGNGQTLPPNEVITYHEAYLFNERDEMFSSLFLTTPFTKNSTSAYYISWTILSPLA